MYKDSNLGLEAMIFLLVWAVMSLLWSYWLDGVSVALAGLGSYVVFRLIISMTELGK